MPTGVLGSFLVRILQSSSPFRHSTPAYFSCRVVLFTTSSWMSELFQRTGISIQSRGAWDGWPGHGVPSYSSSSRASDTGIAPKLQTLPYSGSGEQLVAEQEWVYLDKWLRGGGVVHRLAEVDSSVVVEVGAVVHSHAVIGANSHISSGSVVGPHVVIGPDTKLGYNVALQHCSVGSFCILHSGVCVGQDGFGFTISDKGSIVKKPQILRVQIGNNVEIGANSCIDRGSWRDTVIGDHTKIDNLVQIGHNVVIGRCCMLCGQVGLAGSSTLGDYVVMGGKSGVADHISIASKVRIAAKSAVTANILEPGDYAGFPAVPAKEWRRSVVDLRKSGKKGRRNKLL